MKISDLVPDPANVRKHSKKNLDAIKGSLARFGQQKPIVISKDNIVIAGNGTLEAAKSLKWSEIDIVRSELVGSDITAYGIADNRTGELAEWDDEALSVSLKALREDDFDLGAIGFDENDLARIIKEIEVVPGCDEDEVTEGQVETKCQLGDLWILGNHRLLCGDSTDILQVERLMDGEKADMVFTDPPYGIDVNTDRNDRSDGLAERESFSKIIGDDSIDTALAAYSICEMFSEIICFWGGNYYCHKFLPSSAWIVWDKRVEENQRDVNSDCELAYVKHPTKKSVRIFRHLWKGMIKGSENGEKRVHPTQKPIALAEWCFQELNPKGSTVLDLFLGSGSTLIACEKTNRKCYGMELDPHYCDIIIQRWEKFSGKTAALAP
jgi:DNA modification methylase